MGYHDGILAEPHKEQPAAPAQTREASLPEDSVVDSASDVALLRHSVSPAHTPTQCWPNLPPNAGSARHAASAVPTMASKTCRVSSARASRDVPTRSIQSVD